jgi:hypothetical protein
MGATHREAGGYALVLRDELVKGPLNVRETGSHHPNDGQVTSWAAYWLGTSGYVEDGAWLALPLR